MFTSEPVRVDPQAVEKFQLPGLEDQSTDRLPESLEFRPWNLGIPESDSHGGPEVAAKTEEILAAAHLKAQEIEQQAYEEGFQQGQSDGHERWTGPSEGSVEGEIDQNQKRMRQHVHEVTAEQS